MASLSCNSNPCYGLLWLLLLWFIAWPIAFFVSGIHVLLQPFEACFSFIVDANLCLEKFIKWPRKLGNAIFNCTSSCPEP